MSEPVMDELSMNALHRLGRIHSDVAADVVRRMGGAGHLVCLRCGKRRELTEELVAQYLREGWPLHHDEMMRWVTPRQEDA